METISITNAYHLRTAVAAANKITVRQGFNSESGSKHVVLDMVAGRPDEWLLEDGQIRARVLNDGGFFELQVVALA